MAKKIKLRGSYTIQELLQAMQIRSWSAGIPRFQDYDDTTETIVFPALDAYHQIYVHLTDCPSRVLIGYGHRIEAPSTKASLLERIKAKYSYSERRARELVLKLEEEFIGSLV